MSNLALIIDDDMPTRYVYAHVLGALGFEILEAGDGDEALSILRRSKPALILLDLRLPRRPGDEVLDYIYADPALNDARVAVITAMPKGEPPPIRPHDVYLIKPVLPAQIREFARLILLRTQASRTV